MQKLTKYKYDDIPNHEKITSEFDSEHFQVMIGRHVINTLFAM